MRARLTWREDEARWGWEMRVVWVMLGAAGIGLLHRVFLCRSCAHRLEPSDALVKGAVLAVTVQWDCHDLFNEETCAPHLLVTTLSKGQAYLTSWATYYRRGVDGGDEVTLHRDVHQARGLRILVRAEGNGARLDALQIVTQVHDVSPSGKIWPKLELECL